MPKRDKDSLAGAILGILIGLIVGLIGVAILALVMGMFGSKKKKCAKCSKAIPQNATTCPFCNARLNS